MSKYLKLLAIVEEDYKPITGKILVEGDIWACENVLSAKLNDDFSIMDDELPVDEFINSVLDLARSMVDE